MTWSDKARLHQRLPRCRPAITPVASGGVGSGMKSPCAFPARENRFAMRLGISDHPVSPGFFPPVANLIGRPAPISHLENKRVDRLRLEPHRRLEVSKLDVSKQERAGVRLAQASAVTSSCTILRIDGAHAGNGGKHSATPGADVAHSSNFLVPQIPRQNVALRFKPAPQGLARRDTRHDTSSYLIQRNI